MKYLKSPVALLILGIITVLAGVMFKILHTTNFANPLIFIGLLIEIYSLYLLLRHNTENTENE